MNKRVIVRKIQKEDIDFVIKNIREADKRELEDSCDLNYKDSLRDIYTINENAWTVRIDGDIVAIIGVQMTSYITGNGVPWMISTEGIEKHSLTFLRHCKPVFKKMSCHCRHLFNFVDDRNELAKMWLKWLGFKLEETQPYGPKQLPFRLFKMEVKDV